MTWYSRSGVADHLLSRDLATRCTTVRAETGQLLADLAEFDARKLYLPAAYPSMRAYCTGVLGMSDDVAGRHLQAARAARLHPELFEAVREGRLTLSGVCLLAPRLSQENAGELIAAAAGRTFAEIRELLGQRAASEAPLRVAPMAASVAEAVAPVPEVCESGLQHAAQHAIFTVPAHVTGEPGAASSTSPTFELRVVLDEAARADLEYAQSLLSHTLQRCETSKLVARALKLLV
ncbi:MAG TPA: hypothetical protein VLV15_06025, partial [Dongiaceae bacterium]|nr:hypothetical protein [Dongiaceae bacterium]